MTILLVLSLLGACAVVFDITDAQIVLKCERTMNMIALRGGIAVLYEMSFGDADLARLEDDQLAHDSRRGFH